MATKTSSKKRIATHKKSSTATKSSSARKSASTRKSEKSTRKYSPSSRQNVETEMREFKKGTLKSGSGKKVTSRKQAIAIGLSEARRSGKKVPSKKR